MGNTHSHIDTDSGFREHGGRGIGESNGAGLGSGVGKDNRQLHGLEKEWISATDRWEGEGHLQDKTEAWDKEDTL